MWDRTLKTRLNIKVDMSEVCVAIVCVFELGTLAPTREATRRSE